MKAFSYGLGTFLLLGLMGCNRSERGGESDKAKSFTLSGPTMSTSVRRGETQTLNLTLDRGKEFKQNVTLKVEAPEGVDAELTEKSLKASEPGKLGLKVTANDKATLGDHTLVVSATPETGSATTLKVNVKVTERADGPKNESTTLRLKGPLLATTIKQGDTQTIDLSLSGTHAGDIGLKVDPTEKGLKTELTSNAIKAGDTGKVGLKVTAEKDAALGEHTIHVTGSRDGGTVEAADVRVKVVAP